MESIKYEHCLELHSTPYGIFLSSVCFSVGIRKQKKIVCNFSEITNFTTKVKIFQHNMYIKKNNNNVGVSPSFPFWMGEKTLNSNTNLRNTLNKL